MSSPNSKRQKVDAAATATTTGASSSSSSAANTFLGEIECSICLGYFASAHSIVPCGDTFCYSCLYDLCTAGGNKNSTNKLSCSAQCPMCRSSFTLNSLMPNRKLDNVVEKVLTDSSDPSDLGDWQERCAAATAIKRALTNPLPSSKSSKRSAHTGTIAQPRTIIAGRYHSNLPNPNPQPLQMEVHRTVGDTNAFTARIGRVFGDDSYGNTFDFDLAGDFDLRPGAVRYTPIVARPPRTIIATVARPAAAPRGPPTAVDLTEMAPPIPGVSYTVVYAQRGNRDCDYCKRKINKGDCKMVAEKSASSAQPGVVSTSYHLSCLADLASSGAMQIKVTTDQVRGYAALESEDKVLLIDALLLHNSSHA